MTFHIAFGITNSHSKYIRVVLNSILYNNNNPIVFHILSNHISKVNKRRFSSEIKRFKNCKIEYYKINKSRLKGVYLGKWDISAWYRILIPEILDKTISKVLYLDSDTIVNGSLKELFTLNIKNYSIAAVLNSLNNEEYNKRLELPLNNDYFCSGVILMNLEYWRNNNLTSKILKWTKENRNKILCPDQDALNVICKNSKLLLPFKYGYIHDYDNKIDAIIYHYAIIKPWIYVYKDPYKKIWEKYNRLLNKPLIIWYPSLKLRIKIFLYFLLIHLFKLIK